MLCEAEDPRILQAAQRASQEGIAHIVLVGNTRQISATAAIHGIGLDRMTLLDPATSALTPSFAQQLFALRQKKGMTLDEARRAVLDPLCFANLMVRLGHADGSVAGAAHTTADVVRNAIQLIGLAPAPAR